MPTRIAYWCSSFESETEAIALEVAVLRRLFPSSVAWGLDHRRWALVAPARGHYCLNPKLHLLFRAATRMLEPVFHLNHIFGALHDWFYLCGGRRRPTILTVALDGSSVSRPLLENVDRFVVEYESAREQLVREGISPKRIRLIFPPVDLARFAPTNAPDGPFTVLFASSPERASWLEARGIPQLLEAAALRPNMRFRLLWRPWGHSADAVHSLLRDRGLTNVEIVKGRSTDMPSQYHAAHVTVAPFTRLDRCKPMPNSLLESMACGRPILCTPLVGLAGMVQESRAGVVAAAAGAELAEGLDRLCADWSAYSCAARNLAERWLSIERFANGYQRTYYEVLRDKIKKSVYGSTVGGRSESRTSCDLPS
jgi:glycosyltransferase involved in cell wall biosynthesis